MSFVLAVVFLIHVPPAWSHCHSAYSHDDSPGTANPDWMGTLSDSLLITELSIPGTHDTLSFLGGDAVQCQSLSLSEQLQSGIRALDIRCRHVNDTFHIYHGGVPQGATFGEDVVEVCMNFLAAHPTETIFMRIKEESDADGCTRSFDETLRAYWSTYGGSQTFWQPSNEIPTLEKVRGKIIILQDFDSSVTGQWFGPRWDTFNIQDDYDFSSNWYLATKWEEVKNQFANAVGDYPYDTIYVNFLTGSGLSFPYFVASGHSSHGTCAPRLATGKVSSCCGSLYDCPDCYPWLDCVWLPWPANPCEVGGDVCTVAFEGIEILSYGYLHAIGRNRVGLIMMDFPGPGLIDTIIGLNPWNYPPIADANGPYTKECQGTATMVSLDGTGSSDPDDDPITYAWTSNCPEGSFDDCTSATPVLTVDTSSICSTHCSVSLTVTDSFDHSDDDSTTVNIVDTLNPVITCPTDTTIECDIPADPVNTGSASAVDVCDPAPSVEYSDAITPGACPQEFTIHRSWTAGDSCGYTDTCNQVIEVVDTTSPVINCNAPTTITPPDAPISFTATVTDNCDGGPDSAITGSQCYMIGKGGRIVDKSESCIVDIVGNTITVLDVGGVGDHIEWTVNATDDCGNASEQTCSVLVVNPAGQ